MSPHIKHHDPEHKPKPPQGPKERELAVALTSAAVQATAGKAEFTSLDDAAVAVARVYERMFALVTSGRADETRG